MYRLRIACVGGGPGGVFFATLLRQIAPEHHVVVFERNRAEDTFGFGVVFSDATLGQLGSADPVLRSRLEQTGQYWENIEVRLKGESYRCGGNGMAAITRRALLDLLYGRARELGVEIQFKTEIVNVSDLTDFDLIIGSDGANSIIRRDLADVFQPTIEVASAKFIWFGTTYRFDNLTFLFEESDDGIFAVHGYPINETMGTFIVETNETSWLSAGMDRFDVRQPPGASDQFSKEYLESLFRERIGGKELLVNNSRWGNFKTIKNGTWHIGNVVLLGDSAHTAHFSVGSGTKMAMEDAAALVEALVENPHDLDTALALFEETRRPKVDHIQGAARPSLSWWENFAVYYRSLEPQQFVFHFLTRAISGERLRQRDRNFVERTYAWWRSRHGSDPLESAFSFSEFTTGSRYVTLSAAGACSWRAWFGAEGVSPHLDLYLSPSNGQKGNWGFMVEISNDEQSLDDARDELERLVRLGPMLIAFRGGSRVARTQLSEECRMVHLVPSMVCDDELDIDWARTLILSGRSDFIGFSPERIGRLTIQ